MGGNNRIAFWRNGKDGIVTWETAGVKTGAKVEEKLIGNAAKDEARLAENGAEIRGPQSNGTANRLKTH